MPNQEWLNKEVTISREEISEIIAEEIADTTKLARLTGDRTFANNVQELLLHFAAVVCARIFDDELEVEK